MELRDIEYFAAVAEHGNITRASEALDLTPTALSKSLRRLEESLGARVVKRTPKGVELTTVGAALLAQVQRVRMTLGDIAREAADLGSGRKGHLRIGTGPTLCEELPRVYAAVATEAPDVTFEIDVTDNDELIPLLRKGTLDLVFNDFHEPYDSMIMEPLFRDEYVICASAKHPLAQKERVSVEDLSRERWTLSASNLAPQRLLLRTFLEHGLPPPRVALRTRSLSTRLRALGTSDLLGWACRRNIRDISPQFRVVELPVKELRLRRNIGVLYRKGGYLSPVARRFIEILKRLADEMAE